MEKKLGVCVYLELIYCQSIAFQKVLPTLPPYIANHSAAPYVTTNIIWGEYRVSEELDMDKHLFPSWIRYVA